MQRYERVRRGVELMASGAASRKRRFGVRFTTLLLLLLSSLLLLVWKTDLEMPQLHHSKAYTAHASCLAVRRSSVSPRFFVKVAEVVASVGKAGQGHRRLLYFATDAACQPVMPIPSQWQSNALLECSALSCALAPSFFPATDYVGLLVAALALLPQAVLLAAPRLLILGGGGGVLANLYSRLLPPAAIIDIIEPDAAVLALAKSHMGLSPQCASAGGEKGGVRCHKSSGQHFVRRRAKGTYDLIVLDAFENDGGVDGGAPSAWGRHQR